MSSAIQHLTQRKEIILQTVRRKGKRITHLDELLHETRQKKYNLEESISALRKEYSIVDRELFLLEHPPSAAEKLKALEKELGPALFAQAVALLKEETK